MKKAYLLYNKFKFNKMKNTNSHYKDSNGTLNLRGRELRIRLIKKGVPMLEIAKKLGIKRQAVDYFTRNYGIYNNWKKSNEFFLKNRDKPQREKRKALETIAAQVNEVLSQRLAEASPIERKSYDMAVEYSKGFSKRYSFGFLFDLYNHVNSLVKNKKHFSYQDIATKFNLYAPSARRLLVSVGLKSSNKPLPKKIVSQERKQAIRRGLDNTSWSYADISYFTKVSNVTVQAIHDSGPNGRVVNSEDMFFVDFGCKGRLTPRKASQIYELIEKGINLDKIKRKLKIRDKVLYEAIANRNKYSQKIITNLRSMYPEREITHPYVN